jgi:hypothetical protein
MLDIILTMNKNRQINIRLTEKDVADLEELERLTGSTKSEVLRKYLRLGILKELGDAKAIIGKKKAKKKKAR